MNSIFEPYFKSEDYEIRERTFAWATVFSLIEIDNTDASEYLYTLIEPHIEGKLSFDTIYQNLHHYYRRRENRKNKEAYIADKSIVNMVELILRRDFDLTPEHLLAIHGEILKDFSNHSGEFRHSDINKKEWALNNNYAQVGDFDDIYTDLLHDCKKSLHFNFATTKKEIINHLTWFVSSLWKTYPFSRGNARTITIFFIQYLRKLGYDIHNDVFAKNMKFFRNALVRANFTNARMNITKNPSFLIAFLQNLIYGDKNELDNEKTHILYGKDQETAPKNVEISESFIDKPVELNNVKKAGREENVVVFEEETKEEPKTEKKTPAKKAEPKPVEAKLETKEEPKPEKKETTKKAPAKKAEPKPVEAKPEIKEETKEEIKEEPKPEKKAPAKKAEPKPVEAKPEIKEESKPEKKETTKKAPAKKAEPKPVEAKPEIKEETKEEIKEESKPEKKETTKKAESKPVEAKLENKEEKKTPTKKASSEVKFNKNQTAWIEKMLEAYPASIFGRTELSSLIGLSDSATSAFIKKLLGAKVIIPVTGSGKGKYKMNKKQASKIKK